MAHQVVWSPRALDDVDIIAEYISRDSPAYATAVVQRIIAITQGVGQFPLAGRVVPEFDDPVFASDSFTAIASYIAWEAATSPSPL